MKKKLLFPKLEEIYAGESWLVNWCKREGKNFNKKTRSQNDLDLELWYACWDGKWEKAIHLLLGILRM